MTAPSRDWRCVPVPKPMRALPKDVRGYPVPYIVMRDARHRPHFPINDEVKVGKAIRSRRCAICSKRLGPRGWFVGGPLSFLHPEGAFLDPPSHEECARYAVQVCPYIAAPSYARRLDDRKVRPGDMPEGMVIAQEPGQDDRPPYFVLSSVTAWHEVPSPTPGMHIIRTDEQWVGTEVWRHGRLVPADEATALLRATRDQILAAIPTTTAQENP